MLKISFYFKTTQSKDFLILTKFVEFFELTWQVRASNTNAQSRQSIQIQGDKNIIEPEPGESENLRGAKEGAFKYIIHSSFAFM